MMVTEKTPCLAIAIQLASFLVRSLPVYGDHDSRTVRTALGDFGFCLVKIARLRHPQEGVCSGGDAPLRKISCPGMQLQTSTPAIWKIRAQLYPVYLIHVPCQPREHLLGECRTLP